LYPFISASERFAAPPIAVNLAVGDNFSFISAVVAASAVLFDIITGCPPLAATAEAVKASANSFPVTPFANAKYASSKLKSSAKFFTISELVSHLFFPNHLKEF
jgi:hypothetical protein